MTASLLSSTRIRAQLGHDQSLPQDISPLLEATQKHAQINTYRLGFGITAFPFVDPSPETSDRRLLGVRFDICRRKGEFDSPYYLLCKRADDDSSELRIHRHTIPALVPLQQYEERYLPLQDEGYGSEDSVSGGEGRKQDLHGLVRQVRHDLVSWRLRQEAIELLSEQLCIPPSGPDGVPTGSAIDEDLEMSDIPEGMFGVSRVEAVSVDAYQARIIWSDGRLGRIKITDEGQVDRVVVFGEAGRLRDAERILSRENPNVLELVSRLEQLHRQTLAP